MLEDLRERELSCSNAVTECLQKRDRARAGLQTAMREQEWRCFLTGQPSQTCCALSCKRRRPKKKLARRRRAWLASRAVMGRKTSQLLS